MILLYSSCFVHGPSKQVPLHDIDTANGASGSGRYVAQAHNPTVCAVAKACPELQRLNVASTRCTREVHRMLREFGSEARVFGA